MVEYALLVIFKTTFKLKVLVVKNLKTFGIVVAMLVFLFCLSIGNKPSNSYNYNSFSGSTCRDGWVSRSVGRGTCSHHGGISR